MLQYATLPGLISEMSLQILRQLAPWSEGDQQEGEFFDAGVSDSLVEAVNEKAVALVHGYTRGVYPEPLPDPVDPLIVTTTQEVMHYLLYKQRDAANVPDAIISMLKAAESRLKDVQARKITLSASMLTPSDDQPASYQYLSPPAKFPSGFTRF